MARSVVVGCCAVEGRVNSQRANNERRIFFI
jgi:hypothetical protein